ncbi:MAG: hypothetical protein COB04_13105 [Gammaproteobacteria bacterium]|nr:MAG: hypothetical protein COB04_13105 [Gammaproteobacteria bacterium]
MRYDSPQGLPVSTYEGAGKIRFSGPLEANYQAHYRRRYHGQVRGALIFGLVFFVLAAGLDAIIAQQSVLELWKIRFQYFLPINLVIVAFSMSAQSINYQQLCLVSFFTLNGICILLMSVVSAGAEGHIYYTGVLLIIMAGLTATRMQIKGAVAVSVVMVVATVIIYGGYSPVSDGLLWADLLVLLMVCVISLVSNYVLDRTSRKNYLRRRLLDRRQEALEESNRYLRTIASSDALTGIANRRTFDDVLLDEWRRALRGQYSITLFMIDVDYFKLYNDTYGHQAGDECLKKIATALRAFCRRPGDQVARYGGEEFALILPHMEQEDALLLGREICQTIRSLCVPHAGSRATNVVTVSVGATTQIPEEEGAYSKLIRAADKNLYQSKHQGRNGVCCDLSTNDSMLVHQS